MWGFTVRGSWRPNITEIFWPHCYDRHVVSFLFFDAQPEVQRPLCWVMAFFTASYQHLLRTSTHQGPKAPSAWCGFPYHISSPTGWNSTGNSTGPLGVELNWNRNSIPLARRTQLCYIIVRRSPDLWNRMFNRHQAEITVSSSHFISQFPPTRFPLITANGMCHSLRCITLNGIFGRVKRSKYNSRCSLEDLPGVMDNRDGGWERVKEVHAIRLTLYIYIYIYIYNLLFHFVNNSCKKKKKKKKRKAFQNIVAIFKIKSFFFCLH